MLKLNKGLQLRILYIHNKLKMIMLIEERGRF